MPILETDVAIIGVGSAGMTAYKAARRHTERILTMEHGLYGTTCTRVGCMPSKLLIAAADAHHAVRQAPLFGVQAHNVHVDGAAVMQRVRDERDRFVQYAQDEVAQWPDAHKLRGSVRFVAPGTLQVGADTTVHAGAVVIATGSSPTIPPDWQARLGERLITSDAVFDWQTLPQSVAVLGTGIIGLELATALHDLGVRVRLLGRSGKVGPATDPEVAEKIRTLVSHALPTALHASDVEPQREGDAVVLRWHADGQAHCETFDYLLLATGRTPNLQALDLARAGVALDGKGMPALDAQTRQIPGHPLFIAGDANGQHPVLHVASDDGAAAGRNAALWPKVQPQPPRASLSIVFSRPQIALVGQSHRALTQAGRAFAQAGLDWHNQGRARIQAVNHGLLKLYADMGDGRLLGAEMVGPAAEHLGHLLAWALQQEMSVDAMLACPFYHPTVEEGLRTALQRLAKALKA